MKQKEFRQIDLTGKVYGEFDLEEIFDDDMKNELRKSERGEMVRFTGQTYLMKITDKIDSPA
jgi:hypothetical protein